MKLVQAVVTELSFGDGWEALDLREAYGSFYIDLTRI